ncbi:MAG: molybdopterin molybdotransferase MoeA [Actinomycetia bacterium]|nr:molybdopterin molybdotransferase MoeA [Actinomycetes bacterium]
MMRPLEEMQAEVLNSMPLLDEVEVDFADAIGAVLSRDVNAPDDLPGFENAAMDGFAVIAADTTNPPMDLKVVDDVAAGAVPSVALTSGTVARIMTGAPIPGGADAIVPVEVTEETEADSVRIMEEAAVGDHIRPAGGNVRAGTRVFDAGLRMRAAHASVMASMGIRPIVRRRPVVAMMSTGDELVPPSTPSLARGAIRDSNRTLMKGLLEDLGADVRDYGIVNDDVGTFETVLEEAMSGADAIVTSGGVSMGAYDIVKLALRDRGTVGFWKVAMQPGKPLGFGTVGDVPFFGLPGNPVSVFVSFEQFMRPALLAMMGADRLYRERIEGVLDDGADTNSEKTVFLRVSTARHTDGRVHARKSGGQSSNVLSALAFADALAVVPAGVGRVEPGGTVELEMIHWPEARSRREVLGD